MAAASGTSETPLTLEGSNVESLLAEASDRLNTPVHLLTYRILSEKSGFLGLGRKKFTVEINVSPEAHEPEPEVIEEEETFSPVEVDGTCHLVIRKTGVFLTVTPPQDDGQRVTLDDVNRLLSDRLLRNVDRLAAKRAVDEATGEATKIGEWQANADWDSSCTVEISDDRMKAMVNVRSPRYAGRIMEREEILDALREAGVTFGIQEDAIVDLLESERFDEPVVVAKGKPAISGRDAHIEFHFNVDHQRREFEENEDGSVSFKDLQNIENVVEGSVLATKHPPTAGTAGRTVTNEVVEVPQGNDVGFNAGEGSELSEDGLQIIAIRSGEALFNRLDSIVWVSPVRKVDNVDYNTGNIVFLGTVIVTGNVQDGFSVQATGDINIQGTVGRAEIVSEQNILIRQGVQGKGQAMLKAGNDIYARFIENAQAQAHNDIIVQEDIMHSDVSAGGRIICNGKKATIMGGRVRASQQIFCKDLGADGFPDTQVEAGVDFIAEDKLASLEEERTFLEENLQKLTINIKTLESRKESHGGLSEDEEALLQRTLRAREDCELELTEYSEDIGELRDYLAKLENRGSVSAKNMVYPGVRIRIRSDEYHIKDFAKNVSFLLDENRIVMTRFQDLDDLVKAD